jgi:hypothetical protein
MENPEYGLKNISKNPDDGTNSMMAQTRKIQMMAQTRSRSSQTQIEEF